MIKNFKTKKLIMQVIAFLLVFTLSFGELFSLKAEAVDLKDGDTAVIKLHTSATCSYIIKASYAGGGWTITEKDNQILCNGTKAAQPSFWLSLVKSYCSETGSATAKNMVVKAVEYYVEATGKTVTSDRVSGRDNNTICSLEGGKAKWGRAATGGSYRNVLLSGNPGENASSQTKGGTHINNPLCCASVDQMEDAMKGLQVDGTYLTAMTDEAWLALIMSSANKPSWIDITYNTDGTSITADPTGYYAKLEVPDENKKSGNILIKLYNKNDKNVIDFKFGEIVGEKKYREITYSNSDRKKVVVSSDGDLYLTLKTNSAAANLSLYKTAGGSTIDTYESKIKKDNILNAKKEIECYVAIKDAALNTVDIYGATEAKSNKAKLEKLCSVDLSLLDEIFGEKAYQLLLGDWVFEKVSGKEDTVLAYKSDDPDPEENGWYYYLDELKLLRIEDSDYYDLMVPTKETKSGTKSSSKPSKKDKPFSVLRGDPPSGDKQSLLSLKEALYNEILDGSTVYCSTRTLKLDGEVGTNTKPLKLGDTYTDGREPSGKDYPPDFPINDFILLTDDLQDKLDGNQKILADIYAQLGESKTEIKHEFVDDVLKYGKIVILFLLLLAITYTAILSIQSSTDIKKRVLIKERIKDILIGVIIFACLIPIYNLVAHFVNEAYTSLGEFSGEFTGPTYYATITRFRVGYIVKFIGKVLDVFTLGINWLVDAVLSYSITPGETTDLMELIYTATDETGLVSSLLPFTEAEWAQYTFGYRLLTIIFMGFVAIALVKIAIEYMINAGNANKIEECKESFKRIIVAILIVVLAPYGFRMILLLFNYFTSMLPIDGSTARFDINFEAAGFVGSVANLLFATTRLGIFVRFYVRKVLLALMLIATPFICGIWSISNRFRSFSLWVGTILSNAAMQFCYALVFMVVILISYEGQNPFVTLIVVVLIPRFANFFSSSLQGLGQVWGGINSEQIANEVVSTYKNAGKKTIRGIKKTGKLLQKGANQYDPKGMTKAGRNVYNVGAIMSGDPWSIKTKRETAEHNLAQAESEYKRDKSIFDGFKRNRQMILSTRSKDDPLAQYDQAMADGDFARAQSLRGDSSEYDVIDNYYDSEKQLNLSENKYKGWLERANSTKLKDTGLFGYIPAQTNAKIADELPTEIDRLYNKIIKNVDDSRKTNRDRRGSDEKLAQIMQRAEKAMADKNEAGKPRSREAVANSVDSVFKDLITYMEHAENRSSVKLELTDALFAGLFEKKVAATKSFSPEMAVKYQETKEQYFGDLDNVIVKAVEKVEAAETTSAKPVVETATQTQTQTQTTSAGSFGEPNVGEERRGETKAGEVESSKTTDNVAAGESMTSVKNEEQRQEKKESSGTQGTGYAGEQKQKKEDPKSLLTPQNQGEKAGDEAGVGESLFGAGEKITPGAAGKITAAAGGKAFNDEFSIEVSSKSGFDFQADTYASEHGGDSVIGTGGGENKGGDGQVSAAAARAPMPTKKENMNWGSIGELNSDRKRELIKHHDSNHDYQSKEQIIIPTENSIDANMQKINEKELVDETRLKEIEKIVEQLSADNPYDDADEVVKKALEEYVERELKKERKMDHSPNLRHPDFNSKER